MDKSELIYAATAAVEKGYDYEKMMNSDYMSEDRGAIDEVWEYVEEIQDYGMIAFKEKYKEHIMFGS